MGDGFFSVFLLQPLYNGFIFLIDSIPGGDVGVAVIIFTAIVRLALFPLAKKSIVNQMKIRAYEGDVADIKEKYKTNRQEQAEKIMQFYKEKGLNPLSGLLLVIVQIPIIFGLYFVFMKSGFPEVHIESLYSFVKDPGQVNLMFLGLLDVSAKSYLLALICSATQFFQIKLSLPPPKPKKQGVSPSFGDDLARSMNMQMRYIFPVVVFFHCL
jgi:YidC/Oxa1 family membrane protein insertase